MNPPVRSPSEKPGRFSARGFRNRDWFFLVYFPASFQNFPLRASSRTGVEASRSLLLFFQAEQLRNDSPVGGRTVPTTFGPAKGRWAERKRARGFPKRFSRKLALRPAPCFPWQLLQRGLDPSSPLTDGTALAFPPPRRKRLRKQSVPFTASYFSFDRDKILFKIPLWAISTPQ